MTLKILLFIIESGTAGNGAVAVSTVQAQREEATNIDNTVTSTNSVNAIISNEPANELTHARAGKKTKSKERECENGENMKM